MPMAPSLASLFMAWLEKSLMAASPVLIPRAFWRRFLDDIFLLWTNTRHELDDLILHINSFHSSIKFTINSWPVSLPFLDINISQRDGYLHTDLHTNATDVHGYRSTLMVLSPTPCMYIHTCTRTFHLASSSECNRWPFYWEGMSNIAEW